MYLNRDIYRVSGQTVELLSLLTASDAIHPIVYAETLATGR